MLAGIFESRIFWTIAFTGMDAKYAIGPSFWHLVSVC